MPNLFKACYHSPIGILEVISSDTAVTSLLFVDKEDAASQEPPPVLLHCLQELDEYFKDGRKTFSIPLSQEGTPFQKKVWDKLTDIPFGTTTSYLNMAKTIADAKSIRAVGGANGKNKIAILVPCHRVIGQNMELIGYAGGKWRKQWLLEHEGAINTGQKTLFDS